MGQKLYDGIHTKGETDNKWVTYKGYSLYFTGIERSQLRISPNVLDILSAQNPEPGARNQANNSVDGGINPCDIFISYTKVCKFVLYKVCTSHVHLLQVNLFFATWWQP